jgi:phenylalanyl-tRNA synthetase beta chain
VDFSNLFMNISWLPIHCFDADKIDWDIIVRDAEEWEQFTDLFWAVHTLKSTDLVIADKNRVLALAWVVWGLDSWITDSTKNIIVELANFDPVAVRKTWTRLGLRTDAELRFEKNIAPSYSLYCLLLFLEELKYYSKDLWNYEISWITSYINPDINPIARKTILTPWDEMESLIFWERQENFKEKSQDILRGLWFEVQENSVTVPLWRGPDDMNIKEDITEEIARIRWYDTIKPQPLLS